MVNTKKGTLDDVARLAMDDPEFWKQLRAKPLAALQLKGLKLDPRAEKLLTEILAMDGKKVTVDLDQVLSEARRRARGGTKGTVFWMGSWVEPYDPNPGKPTD